MSRHIPVNVALSFAESARITKVSVSTSVAAVPAHWVIDAKFEEIGKLMPNVVSVSSEVGCIANPPLTVTTLPTRIYWQVAAVELVTLAVPVRVGV